MITKAFSVYDSKALCYGVPFFMPSVGAAVRAFADLSCDPQSLVNRHPADFVLYCIGSFDDSHGVLSVINPFEMLGIGSDFQKVVPTRDLRSNMRVSEDRPQIGKVEVENGGDHGA